ncbi:hypothetical protein ACJVQT_12145 [Enterobacter huaxiensis]|uniref:hypothetical protein n=1 Tax=Enterobacter huaxiensis TaxID=2494702 RepID=UPI003966EDCB
MFDLVAFDVDFDRGDKGGLDLPDVVPTISWVQLAQRVPVRIHIDRLPEGDGLVARLSASVAVGQ